MTPTEQRLDAIERANVMRARRPIPAKSEPSTGIGIGERIQPVTGRATPARAAGVALRAHLRPSEGPCHILRPGVPRLALMIPHAAVVNRWRGFTDAMLAKAVTGSARASVSAALRHSAHVPLLLRGRPLCSTITTARRSINDERVGR